MGDGSDSYDSIAVMIMLNAFIYADICCAVQCGRHETPRTRVDSTTFKIWHKFHTHTGPQDWPFLCWLVFILTPVDIIMFLIRYIKKIGHFNSTVFFHQIIQHTFSIQLSQDIIRIHVDIKMNLSRISANIRCLVLPNPHLPNGSTARETTRFWVEKLYMWHTRIIWYIWTPDEQRSQRSHQLSARIRPRALANISRPQINWPRVLKPEDKKT